MLSVVIISKRDSNSLAKTLRSVVFADEVIVVLDQENNRVTKSTTSVRYLSRPLNSDFSAQRNYGLVKAKGDWVLFVDDDEVVSPALAKEITAAVSSGQPTAYFLKRLDRYFGQILKHGETGDTKIIRLAKKAAGRFIRPVHEVWQTSGMVGELKTPLIHNRQELVSPFIDRIALYGPLDAKSLTSEGKPFSYWRLLINPLAKFIVNYKFKHGFLDGHLGLFQAYLMSVQSLSVRVFQWSLKS